MIRGKSRMDYHSIMVNKYNLPGHMVDSVYRYVEQKIPPGSFMRAVLANELVLASIRADPYNKEAIHSWAEFIHNELPAGCWGSRRVVSDWLESD